MSDVGVRGALLNEVEFVLDASATRQSFRIIPVILPQTQSASLPMPQRLLSYQALDMRHDSVEELANSIRGESGPLAAPSPRVDYGRPYIGLQAFTEQEAVYFAGRTSALQTLLEHVKAKGFTAVVGAAGSGKTSLVQGGLFPALRADDWRIEARRCSEMISAGPVALPSFDDQRALLFVDDFEEVADDEQGESLVRWLTTQSTLVRVVVAIRDDGIPAIREKIKWCCSRCQKRSCKMQSSNPRDAPATPSSRDCLIGSSRISPARPARSRSCKWSCSNFIGKRVMAA
jgi:hypothetical protein